MILPDDLLAGVSRLGFDTAPLIYFVERHAVYLPIMQSIIRRIDAGDIQGYGSVITLTEVLVLPKRNGALLLEKEYSDLLRNSKNFELVPIDEETAERASELRSSYNLRTPDALQIAAALSADCEAFLTNDKKLKQVKEIKVIVLDDCLQQT